MTEQSNQNVGMGNALATKLREAYNQYSFSFIHSFVIYNQDIQVFGFTKVKNDPGAPGRKSSGYMLTFGANPADVLWNIGGTDKATIISLLKSQNRLTSTSRSSQSLFRGHLYEPMDEQLPQRQEKPKAPPPSPLVQPKQPAIKQPVPQRRIVPQERNDAPVNRPIRTSSVQSNHKPSKESLDLLKKIAKEKGWIKSE